MKNLIHQVSIGPRDWISNKHPDAFDAAGPGLGIIVWASWLWSSVKVRCTEFEGSTPRNMYDGILKENFFTHFICDYT